MSEAERKRLKRLELKIYKMIKDKHALFLTLSFTDEILKTTNEATRRRYIKEFLRDNTAQYIANIDYGKKKGREHYHAIVLVSTIKKGNLSKYENVLYKIDFNAYKYGNIKAEYIGAKYGFKTDEDIKRTAQRLTAHTLKDTTKGNKPIFSRLEPSDQEQKNRLKIKYKAWENPRQEMSQEEKDFFTIELDEIYGHYRA